MKHSAIVLVLISSLGVSSEAGAQPLAPAAGLPRAVASPEACAEGWVPDDGSAETGYGWVPSVTDGIYVHEIRAEDFPSSSVLEVCVCWLRTAADTELDFEVVFYARDEEGPALSPYAAVPARATGVPEGVTGRFYTVRVAGVRLVPGTSYVGVRWNPAVDPFFFVCTDTSRVSEPVEAFFIDNLAEDWTSVFVSRDPIFDRHRAMMVRVRSRLALALDVPVLTVPGLVLLSLLVAAAAILLSRTKG